MADRSRIAYARFQNSNFKLTHYLPARRFGPLLRRC